ncbi:MAG: hypothetical protein SPH44_10050 [Eubacteriales bacterium]|nr:hypothetical protein [Eubacteriales bacterium]
MILYLQATTNVQNLVIGYIEVKLKSGKTVSLNRDESGINRKELFISALPEYAELTYERSYTNGI